ncbi:MAG: 4Fe-4S dicluster domain-containing protein [Clostridiales bacterium]|nr:4Fe-4S dicluster domain-containing protein [Clostridiales bacterium]MCF8023383.1 4Fe-4S dicluster domain-containing protein [Clostridiales bacterium]
MKEIYIDRHKCLHCFSCILNCILARSGKCSLQEAAADPPAPRPRILKVQDDNNSFLLMCRHCENPPCIEACMSGAITREPSTGIISIDTDKCMGCWMCIMVCPFGVIGRDKESKTAVKCDHCRDREYPAALRLILPARFLLKNLQNMPVEKEKTMPYR